MNKRVVIFDLDGTLLNTIQDLGQACNHALHTFGYPTHSATEYPRMVGNGINKLLERALPVEAQTESNVQQLREVFVPYYLEHCCGQTVPYEGIVEALQLLKQQGLTLAVASNKFDDATQKIVHHFFGNIFDAVVGERSDVPRKPNPTIVHTIVRELGCRVEDVVMYVGDSVVDVETAHNANVPVCACTWGFVPESQLREQAVPLVSSPSDLGLIVQWIEYGFPKP